MATERQIEANRRNAVRSSGPKTAAGKARSALNATTHSLAGASGMVHPGRSAEFAERRALWEPEFAPEGATAAWALDQAVAASLRIEECGRALGRLAKTGSERARLAWDQDRSVEAAEIYARLAKNPMVAARQLETSFEGVRLLIEGWFVLVQPLELGEDWTESETSKALDLLGVPVDARSRRTLITSHEGLDSVAFRLTLVLDEIERLEAIRDEVMVPLEQIDRDAAMDGDLALLSKSAKLVLRYERDAWRRYREAIRELKTPKSEPEPALAKLLPPPLAEIKPPPKPPRPAPEPRERNEANLTPSFEDERKSLLEDARAFLANFPDLPSPVDLGDDDDAWLDEFEQRLDGSVTERSQFEGVLVGS